MKYKRSQLNKLLVNVPIHMLREAHEMIAAASRAGDVDEDEPYRNPGELEKPDADYANGGLDDLLAKWPS
ncbi:hypothetical protein [Sphingobium sp. CFD-1]|uniref:hypothetical protein n=1 Tax=Sphingobium sp. CFD-1 TaxID=2878545 RepID=UPI00214BCF9E|nr:hypothetical protein [Sphingobium sp. CFD-1]